MKITRDLPQFQNQKALIVVTGLHEADFYIAKNGRIEKIGEFKLLYPHYSDKEGFFETAGHGRVLESGSVLETNKVEIRHRFLKEMDKILDDIIKRKGITDIYIFTPSTIKDELKKLLPKDDRKKIKHAFEGNFTKLHPFQLLSMIQAKEKIGWNVPVKAEAKKILLIPLNIFKKKRRQ